MDKTLHICFDLGSDSLKTAFAYKKGSKVVYGKLTGSLSDEDSDAMPAIAFYDAHAGKWYYADEISKLQISSFVTLVKIKTLIKFLQKTVEKDVLELNSKYYNEKDVFPKFYFPIKKKLLSNLSAMEDSGMTFVAPGFTPAKVCEGFFAYVKKALDESIRRLEKKTGNAFANLTITVVYPFNAGTGYVAELKRLIEKAFGQKVSLGLSSPKALSLFAYHRKSLKNKDKVLVFDMGEEQVSVVKGSYNTKGLALDCVDGHSPSLDVGGNDVDEAVADYIEKQIEKRETMGTPSFGEEGHLIETGLYAMQYRFMREIKCAKKYLASEAEGDYWDKRGVPIVVYRDLMIVKRLKKEEFLECTGISGDNGVAAKIAEYIVNEMKLTVNEDVNKVFLSGGLVETYGLLGYLKKKINSCKASVEVCTFDDFVKESDGYTILSHEDSTYAAAAGGAIVSLCGYKTDTVFSVSYATWVTNSAHREYGKLLSIFANRGDRVETDKNGCCKVMTSETLIGNENAVRDEIRYDMMFSVKITTDEIACGTGLLKKWKKECPNFYRPSGMSMVVLIGYEDYELGSSGYNDYRLARRKAKEILGLKILSGGKDSAIHFFHEYGGKRLRVDVVQGDAYFKEGIFIDADGRATPKIENAKDKNGMRMMKIRYREGDMPQYLRTRTILSSELIFDFDHLDDFDASQD